MEFVRTKVNVKVYGEEFEMRLPTYKESLDYKKELEKAKGDSEKIFDCVINRLEKLGLPKKIGSELESDHLLKLFAFLTEKKTVAEK